MTAFPVFLFATVAAGTAHARILYLQAWMLIQEGDVQAAAALLRDVVLRHPSTKYAKQARSILVSLEG